MEWKLGREAWNKGLLLSEEHKRKISKALKGRKYSEEHKRKMSEAKKGENNSAKRLEVRKKISDALKGKPLSEKTKKKIREALLREKGSNWRGGISFFPYSSEWTDELKQSIKDRDGHECQNPYCEQKAKRLGVHHIDYNKKNCNQLNLITLCTSCNSRANYGDRHEWRRFYKKIIWGKYL